jgi:hypothetical protein
MVQLPTGHEQNTYLVTGATAAVLLTATRTGACPYRVLHDQDHDVTWVNDSLNAKHTRQLSPGSPRAYAYGLPHFPRWFQSSPAPFPQSRRLHFWIVSAIRLSQQPQPAP